MDLAGGSIAVQEALKIQKNYVFAHKYLDPIFRVSVLPDPTFQSQKVTRYYSEISLRKSL